MKLIFHVETENEADFIREVIRVQCERSRAGAMHEMKLLAKDKDQGADIRSKAVQMVEAVGMAERAIELADTADLVESDVPPAGTPIGYALEDGQEGKVVPISIAPNVMSDVRVKPGARKDALDGVSGAVAAEMAREDPNGISAEDDPGREIPANAGEIAANQIASARRRGIRVTPEDG